MSDNTHILTVTKLNPENRDHKLKHINTFRDIYGGEDDGRANEGEEVSWSVVLDEDEEEELRSGVVSNVIAVEENATDSVPEDAYTEQVDPRTPFGVPEMSDLTYHHMLQVLDRAQEVSSFRERLRTVKIAILDTGVNENFPLKQFVTNGKSWVAGENWNNTTHFHGTHVAGSARPTYAKLMIAKVLGNNGSGSRDDIVAAIYWAAENGADVINMSLGGAGSESVAYENAIIFARNRGALSWCAAGNDGLRTYSLPAAVPSALAIGAFNKETNKRAPFSNYGDHLFGVTHGVDVLSFGLGEGELYRASGTSMATPGAAFMDAVMIGIHGRFVEDRVNAFAKTAHYIEQIASVEQGNGRLCGIRAHEYLRKV